MPTATSGASAPLSVAATASGRMGDTIGDEAPYKTRAFIHRESAAFQFNDS